MMDIEAVTFDLWDTLIQEIPGGSARVARLRSDGIAGVLASHGSPFSVDDVERAYSDTGRHLEQIWADSADVTVSYQMDFLLRRLDDGLPDALDREALDRILEIYSESMLEHMPRLLSGAKEALAEMSDVIPKLGLISNTGKTPGRVLRIVMDRLDILRYFDTTTFSDEMLLRKPAPQVFMKTLSDLGTQPGTAVHIGDDSIADVRGAKGVGMRAIQVGEELLERDSDADAIVAHVSEVTPAVIALSDR